MSGGVYPGCHPSQAPGHSGAGHEAGAGDLDPGTSLEQGEWNPLLCFLCHQVRLSRKDRGTQSMMSFNRLTGSPASSPATTLSVLTASRAGVWMASCRVQSVGESSQKSQCASLSVTSIKLLQKSHLITRRPLCSSHGLSSTLPGRVFL